MVDYLSKCIGRLLKRLKRPCWKRGRRVTACVGSNPMSSVKYIRLHLTDGVFSIYIINIEGRYH